MELAERWACAYGTRAWKFLDHSASIHELGQHFGHGLYAREVDYLVDQEWAISSTDILWRRSKLGLVFTEAETIRLDDYLVKLHRQRKQNQAA